VSVLKYEILTMTEDRLPRDGAMLTLVVDVLQIGHGSLSPFEGTVSPGSRSDVKESLLGLDPMGRAKTLETSLRGACSLPVGS
jgi:hypothetical protein